MPCLTPFLLIKQLSRLIKQPPLNSSLLSIRRYAGDHGLSAKQIELIFTVGIAACGVLSDDPALLPQIPKVPGS
jgi:hypothetical protein